MLTEIVNDSFFEQDAESERLGSDDASTISGGRAINALAISGSHAGVPIARLREREPPGGVRRLLRF